MTTAAVLELFMVARGRTQHDDGCAGSARFNRLFNWTTSQACSGAGSRARTAPGPCSCLDGVFTKTRLSDHWDSDARRARQYHLVIAQRAAGLEMGRRTLGQADRGGKVICALSRACQLGSLSP